MNYQEAQHELQGKPPKISFTLLSMESAAIVVVAYLLVRFFA